MEEQRLLGSAGVIAVFLYNMCAACGGVPAARGSITDAGVLLSDARLDEARPEVPPPADAVMVTVIDPLRSGSAVNAGGVSCVDVSLGGEGTTCVFSVSQMPLVASPISGFGVTWGGNCEEMKDGVSCTAAVGAAATVTFWPTGKSVWWVATGGDDSNSGHTPAAAFKTFRKALTTMAPGDALYIDDGTYHESIGGYDGAYSTWDTTICSTRANAPPCLAAGSRRERNVGPNGIDSAHRTKIFGFRRHKVFLDGSKSAGGNGVGLQLFRAAHIEVGNIVSMHTADIDPVEIEQSDDIYIHQVGGAYPNLQSPSDNNRATFYIGDSSNVVVEESWAWGYGGRYGFVTHGGKNNTFRRNVVRYDGSPDGQVHAGVALYSEDNTIAENNIVVDFDSGTDNTSNDGHAPFFGPCSVPLSSPSLSAGLGTISLLGNMAIGVTGTLEAYIQIDSFCSIGGTVTITNNVLAGAQKNSGLATAGIWLQADNDSHHTAVLSHNTIHNIKGSGVRFSYLPDWPAITMFDNLIDGATDCVSDFGDVQRKVGYNQLYGCQGLSLPGDTHLVTTNPSLSYLLRVDRGDGKGTASDGGDRGATVIKRYLNGTLTDMDLWPFPNEDIIRADFCAGPDNGKSINTRGHNASGWCASGKSLTAYIWEQLGQPSPY